MTRRFSRILLTAGVFGLVGGFERTSAQYYYDLSRPSPAPLGSAIINGGYIFSINGTTASGTGTFGTFVAFGGPAFGGPPSESGYNTGLTKSLVMPDLDVSKSDELLRSGLESTTVNGIAYYSFGLDIVESSGSGNEFISLDQLQVWVRSSPLTDASTLALLQSSGATKVWDMDTGVNGNSSILLNYNISSSGSGKADVSFLVPKTLIDTGTTASWNIYLYSELGATDTVGANNYRAESGFEEWQNVSGLTFTPPPLIPEASTVGAIGTLAGLAGLVVWKRRQAASKA